jgi:hypothetical protein
MANDRNNHLCLYVCLCVCVCVSVCVLCVCVLCVFVSCPHVRCCCVCVTTGRQSWPQAAATADVLTKWLSLNDFAKHRGKLTNRRAQYKMLEQKKKI